MTGLGLLFSAALVLVLVLFVVGLQRFSDRRFGVHEPGLQPADRDGCSR